MSTIKIKVIIVTYNSAKNISLCINRLLNSSDNNLIGKIIVLDNNSQDDTLLVLRKIKDNRITLLENKNNVGFARAINQGIQHFGKSDYYLLLNPDAYIQDGSLGQLIKCSNKYKAGIVGGRTISLDGKSQGDHFREPNIWVGIFDFTNLRKLCPGDYWHNYFYYNNINKDQIYVGSVTGGFMLIKESTIKKIGLLNENYFMYLEDVEYCKKARDCGVKVVYCPHAISEHIGGASSNNKERSNQKAWLYSRKYYFMHNTNVIVNFIIQPIFQIDGLLIKIKQYFNENFHH